MTNTTVPSRRTPPGTIREPHVPDRDLAERVRRGQEELKPFSDSNRKSETLTEEDFAIRINARD